MSVKTQGTQLYVLDVGTSASPEVLAIQCSTSIDGIGAARDQIETTCLESDARTYDAGLPTPGTMTVAINYDPANASHVRLHELYVAGTKFEAAIGWGDGTSAPTVGSDGMLDLPTDRTFIVMNDTFVSDFPFSFALNAVVVSNVTFQLSGFPTVYPKGA
jgi:hypothetical protein